jgi:carboxyl-terminal processing protease
MKKLLSLLCVHSITLSLSAQTDLLPTQQKLLREVVAKKHISPKLVNDQFSNDFYTTYLQVLDGGRLFFTAADVKKLESFRSTIDDEWNNATTNFFTTSAQLYKTKLQMAKATIIEVCAKPFDFSLPEFYNFSDTAAALTDKALYTRWQNMLKVDVLQSLMNIALNQWQTKKAIVKAEVMTKEPEVRSRVKAKYLAQINSFLENDADYQQHLTSIYLNTFLTCLDPHSAFFDATARQQFKASLNTEGLSFGFSLDENERGEVVIHHLAPGSAAWMSGMLNKGDVLVQLKWEGSQAVDLAGLEVEDIQQLLALHTKEKMELTVRKGNGQSQVVVLQKQKLENEDNIVKSFVLSGSKNIGYVMLPSFYTEWEEGAGSRCAADVAKEIVKLKKDSIAGLILDLRFNGGGSLQEAIEMAGIFIDEGAICQIKSSDGKLEVLKDMNRGVIYNGPMLVLVNGQSASASELVAAALQDYNRAIIAGTPTYGKATGQNIVPLQEPSYSGAERAGFAKLTMIKLFRPTGKTAQKAGVQPDILLPDLYDREQRESNEPFALAADTVSAYKYFKPMKSLSLAGVQQKSNNRFTEIPKFKEGKRLAQLAAGYRKKGKVSLKWEDAEREIKTVASGTSENLFAEPTNVYRVRNNTADQKFTSSALANEFNAFWLKRLSADMYVEEAFQILSDFIQLQ